MRIRETSFTILLLALFLPVTQTAWAQDFPSEPVGMVNDFAKLLPSSERQMLEEKLRNYRDTTTNVIAIATLPDLKGYDIQQVGTQLFNDWKMWHEQRYNGVLILVAPNERKIRIEVGYGLEGAITDAMSGRIIREIITPAFKRGNYAGGLDQATTVMIKLAEGEFEGELAQQPPAGEGSDTASTIIFILFVLFVVYASSRRGGGNGKRRRTLGSDGFIWFGGGGFGSGSSGGSSFGGGSFGGFSGGGGFGSGGGGASGGW